MKLKKLTAMILAVTMSLTVLAGCGGSGDTASEGSAAAEKKGDVVIVGTNPTFEPFEYQDESGNMTGFDLDLMAAIGEDQGFDVEFKSLEFDALVGAITTGNIDVVASGMSITPERLKSVAFADPYMDASLGIMVAADSDIASKEDLAGKALGAQIGTTGADEVNAMKDDGTIADAKILDNYNTCIQELLNGGIDAIIIDIPVAQAFMAKQGDKVKLVGEPYVADYYGLAVKKDNTELQEKLNKGLANLIENGKFEELCKKYELDVPESITDGSAKEAVAKMAAE